MVAGPYSKGQLFDQDVAVRTDDRDIGKLDILAFEFDRQLLVPFYHTSRHTCTYNLTKQPRS